MIKQHYTYDKHTLLSLLTFSAFLLKTEVVQMQTRKLSKNLKQASTTTYENNTHYTLKDFIKPI